MLEVILFIMAALSSWNIDYYPGSLDSADVAVTHYENKTVIDINKSLVPAQISCTGSMQPLIGCGNKVYLKELAADDEVNIGDIIAYRNGDEYIMHQVVDENTGEGCYYLKGFNNVFMDQECIDRDDMEFRVAVILPTGE